MKPFQILLSGNGFLVNRGVVFGLGNENQENTFVVTNSDGIELVDLNKSFSDQTNYFPHLSEEYLVCLKIVLKNIVEKTEELATKHDNFVNGEQITQEIFYNYSQAEFFEELSTSDTDYLEVVDTLKEFPSIFFLPKTNWAPEIESVQIENIDFSSDDDSDEDNLIQFDFIKKDGEDYFKYVPVAHYKNGTMTQLFADDYFFSFPFWVNNETIELFISETE